MRSLLLVPTSLLFAHYSAGCLESQPRSEVDTDTLDAEVGFDTAGDVDARNLCEGVNCDDGDACTFDRCDPTTGQCLHESAPSTGAPVPSCSSIADCDDGNPCTNDTCETVSEGCGVGPMSMCYHTPILGCGSCEATCNDNDPCTRDSCTDNACLHEALPYCMTGCTLGDASPLASVLGNMMVGSPIKTIGTLGLGAFNETCNDGPTCDCSGFPAISEEDLELVIGQASDATEVLACGSTGCAPARDICKPAAAGVRYLMWGTALSRYELTTAASADAAPVPAPMAEGLWLEDYCLETTAASLVGDYRVEIELGGIAVITNANIANPANPVLSFSGPTCQGPCPDWVRFSSEPATITVGDGYIDVPMQIAGIGVVNTELVRLFSYRNTLRGGYGLQAYQAIAAPWGGHITLTRVAP
jgi:hypothetical protein